MTWTVPYILELVTAPTGTVITNAEMREQLRLDDSVEEEQIIGNSIRAAQEYVEGNSGKQLLTATYDLKLFDFPCGAITWPKTPLQSVTWIKYIDGNGVEQTLDSSLYTVQNGNEHVAGYIQPAYAANWPTTRGDDRDVTIRAVCGFGAKCDVPHAIREQVRLLAYHWFNSRSAVECGSMSPVPLSYQALEQFTMRQEFV